MPERRVLVPRLGVIEIQVPLAESTAPGVLAAQPHRRAFEQKRAKSQHLAIRPVDGPAFLKRFFALLNETVQLGMQVEIFGERSRTVHHLRERLLVHRRSVWDSS